MKMYMILMLNFTKLKFFITSKKKSLLLSTYKGFHKVRIIYLDTIDFCDANYTMFSKALDLKKEIPFLELSSKVIGNNIVNLNN